MESNDIFQYTREPDGRVRVRFESGIEKGLFAGFLIGGIGSVALFFLYLFPAYEQSGGWPLWPSLALAAALLFTLLCFWLKRSIEVALLFDRQRGVVEQLIELPGFRRLRLLIGYSEIVGLTLYCAPQQTRHKLHLFYRGALIARDGRRLHFGNPTLDRDGYAELAATLSEVAPLLGLTFYQAPEWACLGPQRPLTAPLERLEDLPWLAVGADQSASRSERLLQRLVVVMMVGFIAAALALYLLA